MKYLIPIALITLAGCAVAPTVPKLAQPVPTAADDSCGAAQYGSLVGRDGTALERVMILRQVRILRPGMAVTQEFRAERLNFRIGTDGRIAGITCG